MPEGGQAGARGPREHSEWSRGVVSVGSMSVLTSVINSSASRPAAHLDVLPGGDPSEAGAIKLADIGEHDRLGGHVEASGEGLCEENGLESGRPSYGFRLGIRHPFP